MSSSAAEGKPTQSSVETLVPVDPDTAFRLFTEEIDAWWVPGPINYFNANRSPRMHIEPYLGGRVLEQYPDGALVIATITRFEPGVRLDLRGVVDDSMTEIHFQTHPAGTVVRVHAYMRPGGRTAFLFWPNVIRWLSSHAATIKSTTPRSLMSDRASSLSAAHDIVLHNWPSRDVPDTLVRAGFAVTVYGGPEPDDISVCELVDGEIVNRKTGRQPDRSDLMYVFPWPGFDLERDLPGVASNAVRLGATTLWYQSGHNSDGTTDTAGCWLPESEAAQVESIGTAAGLTVVHDTYIGDRARALLDEKTA